MQAKHTRLLAVCALAATGSMALGVSTAQAATRTAPHKTGAAVRDSRSDTISFNVQTALGSQAWNAKVATVTMKSSDHFKPGSDTTVTISPGTSDGVAFGNHDFQTGVATTHVAAGDVVPDIHTRGWEHWYSWNYTSAEVDDLQVPTTSSSHITFSVGSREQDQDTRQSLAKVDMYSPSHFAQGSIVQTSVQQNTSLGVASGHPSDWQDFKEQLKLTGRAGEPSADVDMVSGPRTNYSRASVDNFTLPVLSLQASRVTAASGDDQIAEAGARYAGPLTARAETASGEGVPGVPIRFTIQGNSGSRFDTTNLPKGARLLDPGTLVITTKEVAGDPKATGTAVTPAVIAGNNAGDYTVEAQGPTGVRAAEFHEHVVAGEPNQLSIVSGDGQQTPEKQAFASNLQVKAVNLAGAAVPGAQVTFTVEGPTGTKFEGAEATAQAVTDADGVAGSPSLIAGFSGDVTVVAHVDGAPDVPFHLHVTN